MDENVRILDALSHVRQVADERAVEGIAIPYGVVSPFTNFGSELIAPGAFRSSVDKWTNRGDGAKVPFRAAHGKDPIGVVTQLRDEADGVHFRASIFDGAEGDAYLQRVRAGLNGVSIEASFESKNMAKTRDGITVQRLGQINAIAGSIAPAYDGARIALRDLETLLMETDKDTQIPVAAAVEAVAEIAPATQTIANRDRAELETRDVANRFSGLRGAYITRSEPVYGPNNRDVSFLRDILNQGFDASAAERQSRHNLHLTDVASQIERAGDALTSEIPGALPTEFLPGLLTPRILKGRPFGGFYDRFVINNPAPKTFAKVTTSTASAVQSAEGAALGTTDIATTAVTVTPSMRGGTIDVSRQVIDAADPSAEAMILADLYEAYAQDSETAIKTAVEAGSTASGVAVTAATPYAGVLANVINYYGLRFKEATGAFIPSALYAVLLAQGDTTGRPFLPMAGLVNSDGSASNGGIAANVLGATTRLSYASTANVCIFARSNDFVIYESPVATVRFLEVVGPQSIRLGVWAYLGIGTRLGSLKVTAA